MSLKRIWSPGIAGFIILIAALLYPQAPGKNILAEVSPAFFLTLPFTATLCLGALVKALLERGNRENADKRPHLLEWIDIALGFTGICAVVFLLLVLNATSSRLSDRILPGIGFLVCCGLGYLLFFKWKAFNVFKNIAFTLVWAAACLLSWFVLTFETTKGEQPMSLRDVIVSDLSNLTANIYQYRIRPVSKGGGGGSFADYGIPPSLASNENGAFSIVSISADTVIVRGTAIYGEGSVTATVDKRGRMDLTFQGDLLKWPPRDWREKFWRAWGEQ